MENVGVIVKNKDLIYVKINSLTTLYLIINKMNVYFEKKKSMKINIWNLLLLMKTNEKKIWRTMAQNKRSYYVKN